MKERGSEVTSTVVSFFW